MTTFSIALPVFNAAMLIREVGNAVLLTFHVETIAVISVASALVWLRVRNASKAAVTR